MSSHKREFTDGARGIARGALAAGCNFFAGYPITPASPILHYMIRELPKVGGVAIQGEDEISSIGMCIGAAMTGAKCMTATSGPGMSLYSENIGLAIMGEVPLVIVNVMRLGPATGGATTVSQGDVQFVRWGTAGGYPTIALSPTNPRECYDLTIRSFQLAERFRAPVFLLTDREVVGTMSAIATRDNEQTTPGSTAMTINKLSEATLITTNHVDPPRDYPFPQLGGQNLIRFTGSTHDEGGFLTKDPDKVARLNNHLATKINDHRNEIESVSLDLQSDAKTLIVSYGITARSAIEAVRVARRDGKKVSSLVVYSLWPVAEAAINEALKGINRVVIPELNHGQYELELERIANATSGHRPDIVGVHRVDGELISPQQILEAL